MDQSTTPPIRNRRDALRLLSHGVGASVAFGFLAACTDAPGDQTVVLDSYYGSGDGRQAILDALAETPFASTVQIGTTNRETFTASIDGYLASRPGTVFTWAAGHQLSALIRGGGISEVSSVWAATDLNPRLRRLASDSVGVQYLVPLWFDPWGFFYRRTSWADLGYSEPTSAAELIHLSEQMAADGISAFGLSRLASPALLALFDYIGIALHGVVEHRRPIVEPGYDGAANQEAVFEVIRALAEIEVGLGETAPVSIVPGLLSEAATRAGSDDDLGCFVLGSSGVVAQVEGFLLAQAPVDSNNDAALELLKQLASIDPQQAFLGDQSSILPANLNANYQAMSPTMLKMVEVIDESDDVVEPTESAPVEIVNLVLTQLTEIVRPS